MIRLLERFELWLRHRFDQRTYSAPCKYCQEDVVAPHREIYSAVRAHLDTEYHKSNHMKGQL